MALGDINLHFVWILVTSTCTLCCRGHLWHGAGTGGALGSWWRCSSFCGRHGAWRHRPSLGVAGVALGDIDSATLRMLPRPAVAIHLYPWFFGTSVMATKHDHPALIHNTCTYNTLYTQYVLTPHIYTHTHTHFCPARLFPAQFFDTHFPRQYLYTQHFYTRSCPTPLFHPQDFHTRLFHTHAHHFYTPLLHTTPLHTLLSPTTPLHGTLSHTSPRHAFLAHTDPPPSLFSSLPFPSHLHLSLPTYRKKLTCRVGWSFNFTICAYSLRQYANTEWNQSSPKTTAFRIYFVPEIWRDVTQTMGVHVLRDRPE